MSAEYGGEGEQYTTIQATVVDVTASAIGLAIGGNVFEGADDLDLGVAVGNVVLADYLPSSGQYIIVAIVP